MMMFAGQKESGSINGEERAIFDFKAATISEDTLKKLLAALIKAFPYSEFRADPDVDRCIYAKEIRETWDRNRLQFFCDGFWAALRSV